MQVLHGSSLQTDAVGWTIVTSKAVKRTMCFSDRSKRWPSGIRNADLLLDDYAGLVMGTFW